MPHPGVALDWPMHQGGQFDDDSEMVDWLWTTGASDFGANWTIRNPIQKLWLWTSDGEVDAGDVGLLTSKDVLIRVLAEVANYWTWKVVNRQKEDQEKGSMNKAMTSLFIVRKALKSKPKIIRLRPAIPAFLPALEAYSQSIRKIDETIQELFQLIRELKAAMKPTESERVCEQVRICEEVIVSLEFTLRDTDLRNQQLNDPTSMLSQLESELTKLKEDWAEAYLNRIQSTKREILNYWRADREDERIKKNSLLKNEK
jgi:hypothetical protein